MIRSALASLTGLALSASIHAGVIITPLGGSVTPLGDPVTSMGSPLGMPALAIIGAVGLIAGIRYLRNKRS